MKKNQKNKKQNFIKNDFSRLLKKKMVKAMTAAKGNKPMKLSYNPSSLGPKYGVP